MTSHFIITELIPRDLIYPTFASFTAWELIVASQVCSVWRKSIHSNLTKFGSRGRKVMEFLDSLWMLDWSIRQFGEPNSTIKKDDSLLEICWEGRSLQIYKLKLKGLITFKYKDSNLTDWDDDVPFIRPIFELSGSYSSYLSLHSYLLRIDLVDRDLMENFEVFEERLKKTIEDCGRRLKDEGRASRGLGAAMSHYHDATTWENELGPALRKLSHFKLWKLLCNKFPPEPFMSKYFERRKLKSEEERKKESARLEISRHWILYCIGAGGANTNRLVGDVTKWKKDPWNEINFRIVDNSVSGKFKGNAVCFILVFDASENVSILQNLKKELNEAMTQSQKPKDKVAVVLIGVYDSSKNIKVDEKEARKFADQIGAIWIKAKGIDLQSPEIKRMFRILITKLWNWYPISKR